jgi:hypothetical protein
MNVYFEEEIRTDIVMIINDYYKKGWTKKKIGYKPDFVISKYKNTNLLI